MQNVCVIFFLFYKSRNSLCTSTDIMRCVKKHFNSLMTYRHFSFHPKKKDFILQMWQMLNTCITLKGLQWIRNNNKFDSDSDKSLVSVFSFYHMLMIPFTNKGSWCIIKTFKNPLVISALSKGHLAKRRNKTGGIVLHFNIAIEWPVHTFLHFILKRYCHIESCVICRTL